MRLQKMIVHVAHIRCGIILLVKKKKKLPLLILYEIYSIFIKVLLQICDLVSEILG